MWGSRPISVVRGSATLMDDSTRAAPTRDPRSIEQERVELETLATGDRGADACALLRALATIMRESAHADAHPRTWVDGDPVLELERRAAGGLLVRVAREVNGRLQFLFEVPFARIRFDDVVSAVCDLPSIVAPAFVALDDDALSISVVRWLHALDVLEEPTPGDEARTSRTSEAVRSLPDLVDGVDEGWDPDNTVVAPPSDDLIERTRRSG
jgi:hypothetical protein